MNKAYKYRIYPNAVQRELFGKTAEQGKKLITIDKWYPSSKLCRKCGVVNTELTLSDRSWICPSCGSQVERDYNAAINIRNEGLAMIA